jgi:DNA-binding SARP family transcriptional activator
MYVSLLNAFELRDIDRVIPLPQSAERLVSFLAINEGSIDRLHVAGTLWPDVAEARATACLRSTLWRIRHAGDGVIVATSSRVRLGPLVVADLQEFNQSVRRVLDRPVEVRDEDVARMVAPAELLPGWYEDWVLVERERVRQMRLHALERLCGSLTEQRRFAEAVEAGLAAVQGDPLRETAQRALIGAYLAEGNCSEAVRAYQGYRRLLNDQLGLDPSAELDDLLRSVSRPL